MAVPDILLARLRELNGPLSDVQGSIASIYELRAPERGEIEGRVDALERVVDEWLDRTEVIEDDLIALVPPIDDLLDRVDDYQDRVEAGDITGDIEDALSALRTSNASRADGTAADALGRLCGLSLLHIAIACDVGSLAEIDELTPDELLTSAFGLPATQPRTIEETAYGAELIKTLGSDFDSLQNNVRMSQNHPRHPELRAMEKILGRATDVTKSILSGAAPSGALFSHIKPALTMAAAAGAAELRRAFSNVAGKIARIVGKLLGRVGKVIDSVLASYASTINRFIAKWVDRARDQLVDSVIRAVLDRVFGTRDLEDRISLAYAGTGQRLKPQQRNAELEDLLKKNKRWVGPAGTAAKGLHFLWPVQVGPVPTAPVAACALLAWTLAITGDQLDARGPYPKFWTGVGTIATR